MIKFEYSFSFINKKPLSALLRFYYANCNYSFIKLLRKVFSRNDRNQIFQAERDKLRKFSCPKCDKRFFKKQTMNSHLNSVHYKIRCFQCFLCFKRFSKKYNLKRHQLFL
ncbi:hypothetical protein MHBO_003113 [Bonamia ostreae]|uniref:C2H2-type domain-containing protein n=1 Tax=Bonamia ostreae TaxID=126728 RepID=A0ABV2AQ49_9EUKA